MKLSLRHVPTLAFITALLGSASPSATAQQFQEGISGTVDAKRRSPVVSFGTVRGPDGVKILIDAYLPNGDYEQYPIRFDLYVNRHLLVSQIRSRELPGPIGATVPPTVATPPFNFSIVATLLHPNRQFSSVAQGAIYPVELAGTFSCKITVADGTETVTLNTSEAKASQSAPDRMTLSLPKPLFGDSEGKQSFSADLTVTGLTLAGTIVDAEGTISSVSGSATLDQSGSRLQSFDVAGTESLPSLECTNTDSSSSTAAPTDVSGASESTSPSEDAEIEDEAADLSSEQSPPTTTESTTLPPTNRPSSAEEIIDALLGTTTGR